MSDTYPGRLALQQRVLPDYRVPFLDMLSAACDGGLSVFAGSPRPHEGILPGALHIARHAPARNWHILGGPAYLCYQAGLIPWLARWDPGALIVEANPRYLSTPAAIRWMHERGRPVIGWGLGAPPINGLMRSALRSRRRAFLQRFDALIAYSRRGAQEYRACGVAQDRVFVAANAVSPRPTRRPERGPMEAAPTILFVGRLQQRKHVDHLLRACAAMSPTRPHLIVVGDGPERSRLESLARQVYPTAEFVGAMHGSDLEPFFQRADLFVLPGTGGLAAQQAMAHALPVIVARGDGTQDDLVQAGNGWQIPPDDYTALVSALQIALADKERLRRMGLESFRIVTEEVNLEAMVQAFVGTLRSLSIAGAQGPQAAPDRGGR